MKNNKFLILSITGDKNYLGLKVNNKFFKHKIQKLNFKNDSIVNIIIKFLKKHNAKISENYSIIVNLGPGSFSSIRASLTVAKGIKLSCGAKIYGFKDSDLREFKLENIEFLINKKLVQNKLIKPVYAINYKS